MIQSSLKKQPRAEEQEAFPIVLRVSSTRELSSLIESHWNQNLPVRVVTVVCCTKNGKLNEPVLGVLLVEHAKGGGFMLPQGKFEATPGCSPFFASRALLRDELNFPDKELHLVAESCMTLASHEHTIPKNRGGHLSEVSYKKKLLVFTKVCVSTMTEHAGHPDIERMHWARDLGEVKMFMSGMRDALKSIAEEKAVKIATHWE